MKRLLPLALLLIAFSTLLHAQFKYTTFEVPDAATNALSVQAINNSGVIAGYLTDTSGNLEGWVRATNGDITLLVDPLDTTSPSASLAYGLSNSGIVTGYFYDTSANLYYGYFYSDGNYTTYQVPGQPTGTDTALGGIYNYDNFCGLVLEPPYSGYQDFVSINGVVTVFSPFGSTSTNCFGINSSGTAVGFYDDSAGVTHGWMRESSGKITQIDDPDASTDTGTNPCLSSPVGGSWAGGINEYGYISGHYWDKSYNEHGFLRSAKGAFVTLNVPGAFQTAGGGLNNAEQVVGHYATDSSCNDAGYIATPK
jgi:hypothetical protein